MRNIDANLLKSMLISGSNNVFNNYPEIDSLNVFPVPDGDTGMNMNLTLTSGVKEIQNMSNATIYEIAKTFSRGLLMGARGNSGVITSQIFRGFSKYLENQTILSSEVLIDAFQEAKKIAYRAVMKPVEGTILTVVRESSDYIKEHCKSSDSIEKIFDTLLAEAKASLARTPELLPVLKEAGVIDSGGFGYIKILEGMISALKGQFIDRNTISKKDAHIDAGEHISYKVKCELVIEKSETKKTFNEKRFISTISSHGNNIDLKTCDNIVTFSLDTLNPGWIISFAQGYGEFKSIEINNNNEDLLDIDLTKINNSNNESVDNTPLKEFGMISCCSGDGIAERFKQIGVDYIVLGGQTMNPSTEDFVNAIKKVHAKNIFIFPNNSNIQLAATQACSVIGKEVNASVVPTSTIPQGLTAAATFDSSSNFEDNFRDMKSILKNVQSASVTYAIKDSLIDGVKVKKGQYMALVGKKILGASDDKVEALKIALDSMINDLSSVATIIFGEDIKDSQIEEITNYFTEKYPFIELDALKGGQPIYSFIIGVE